MGAEALLHAAVINNARWYDAVCRSDWAILACHRDGALVGGVIAYTSDGVTGISNVFKSGSAGFRVLGPLRVWTRGSAVP